MQVCNQPMSAKIIYFKNKKILNSLINIFNFANFFFPIIYKISKGPRVSFKLSGPLCLTMRHSTCNYSKYWRTYGKYEFLGDAISLFCIQEIFTDASELLYTSTHRRAYFKSIKVVIPKTWSNNGSYSTVSGLISSTIHIKVGNQKMVMPFTIGSEECGKEGMYMHLDYQAFVLNPGSTSWGKHGKFIHQRAHNVNKP